jgi:cell division protein FtsI/penicillin-binding protein 2/type II secretory pathway pseudopilin PulG
VLIVVGVLVVALVAAAVPLALALNGRRERQAQREAAASFASAWQGGKLGSISYAGDQAKDVAARTQQVTSSLTPAKVDAPASVQVESVSTEDDATTADLSVSWTLPGGRAWRYETTLPIAKLSGEWLPDWKPQVIHPKLQEGQVLVADRQRAPRAPIIGADDEVLVQERPVVVVGLEPARAKGDVTGAAEAIAAVVDVDAASLAARARKASPTSFVEVITLRREAYDAVRSRLQPIPGAVFREEQRALAPTPTFARALLGGVGNATAEIVKESKGRVRAGDVTGISGLQLTYDERLSGTAGVTVQAVPAKGTGSAEATSDPTKTPEESGSAPPVTLFEEAAKPGAPLRTTIDRRVQEAAEAALLRAPKPAALVAMRVGTGEVLAVGNGGPNAAGYNRALLGQYAPGSTFKIVSTMALLGAGLQPTENVNCPPNVVVNGKTFTNAENEVLGPVPFATDFAHSCNTAFVGSADRITGKQLADAATALGYGRPDTLGVKAFMGSVPDTDDPVGHAAAVIGQGKVLASPLAVVGATAAVAAGKWTAPRLVTDPAPEGASTPEQQLDAKSTSSLREMMRSVVTDGTATVLRNTPGGPVSGKTGTAEFGSDDPPKTHAWFTGFQGDVAFAVIVEDGGFGAETAAPIAGDFLARLAQ